METNWNQLIERYLQNELSEEGKTAFEQELHINPELREELEMHELIQSAAKRASQRMVIKQTAKAHFRHLRIKQFTIGVVVTAATTVGIVYWVQSKKQQETTKPNSESFLENKQEEEEVQMSAAAEEESIPLRDTIINQPNQAGDKSSLIQSSDWQSAEGERAHGTTSFNSLKSSSQTEKSVNSRRAAHIKSSGFVDIDKTLKNVIPFTVDSVVQLKPTVTVLGYTNEKLEGKVIETSLKRSTLEGAAWNLQYDSVGHFNDLYCGYALVMNDAKFGFVDRKGNIFIPLIYDKIVITSNLQSSKDKTRRKDKKVLYIPKRSGGEVQYCEEYIPPVYESDSNKIKKEKE